MSNDGKSGMNVKQEKKTLLLGLPSLLVYVCSWWIAILSLSICLKYTEAKAKELSLGDINVMVLTDVHSWVAGHLPHIPRNDADYGDVLSFYEHLQTRCKREEKDIFFVMNG